MTENIPSTHQLMSLVAELHATFGQAIEELEKRVKKLEGRA